jgi:hypothetical protein
MRSAAAVARFHRCLMASAAVLMLAMGAGAAMQEFNVS